MAKSFADARLWAAVLFSFSVYGCAKPKPDPIKEKQAREVYSQIARGDAASIEARLSPEAKAAEPPEDRRKLYATLSANVPAEAPTMVSSVTWTAASNHGPTYVIIEDYEYSTKYVEATIIFDRSAGAGQDSLQGFHFDVISKKDVTKYLIPKNPVQLGVAGVGLICLFVTLAALVNVFARKGVKRRWLWILFIIFGVGSVKVNWGTGALVSISMAWLQLFSFGAIRGPAITSPWIVILSAPLGALVFLIRGKPYRNDLTR